MTTLRLPDATSLRIPDTIDEDSRRAMEDIRHFLLDFVQIQERVNTALSGQRSPQQFTLATLPSATSVGIIYVVDATGGGVPCYTRGDGVWRRYDTNLQVT